jgi:hypothetical protein
MFVSDLRHFLDLADDAPGPARRMAEQLTMIVRAATAGDAGVEWVSALRCARRPGRRPCPSSHELAPRWRSDPVMAADTGRASSTPATVHPIAGLGLTPAPMMGKSWAVMGSISSGSAVNPGTLPG